LPSDFDGRKPGTAGVNKPGAYTFGISREHYRKVYYPQSRESIDDSIPGPGMYNNNFMTMGTEGRKWNFQGRSPHPTEPEIINKKKNIPGPGTYDTKL